jgi:hypothetical protein
MSDTFYFVRVYFLLSFSMGVEIPTLLGNTICMSKRASVVANVTFPLVPVSLRDLEAHLVPILSRWKISTMK